MKSLIFVILLYISSYGNSQQVGTSKNILENNINTNPPAITTKRVKRKELSIEELAQKKIEIENNNKNQIPNSFSAEVYTKLKISTPICEDKKLDESIIKCSSYKCLNRSNLFGFFVYSELIIHGVNSSNNCAISGLNKRFFVPKKDLQLFSKILRENAGTDSVSIKGSFSISGSNSVQTIYIDKIPCKILTEYKNELDTSNTEVVIFNPPKAEGYSFSSKNGVSETYFTENGKTYRAKSGELKFKSNLVSYKLDGDSVQVCKDKGSTIFFDLEKQGLVQNLQVPIIM